MPVTCPICRWENRLRQENTNYASFGEMVANRLDQYRLWLAEGTGYERACLRHEPEMAAVLLRLGDLDAQ